MILPSKHLSEHRAILSVGAEILLQIKQPIDASELWEIVRDARAYKNADHPLSFDWFTLALTFLFAVSALGIQDGLIIVAKRGQDDPLN